MTKSSIQLALDWFSMDYSYDNATVFVALIEDINGNGKIDIIIGAPTVDDGDKIDSGQAYVVFGKPSLTLLWNFET
ncbi:hypothetical protein MHYMCMPASI_00154 [Hyalomma marginatum]|uniref:Uncharacterized protein n=1 Tax=Hyalomma marginatum TaxID=34627 RepID=A0A8S4BZQ9_9ACAR|nr:hypothetical protein MHYMCMPASI_00154 [Hyalomma marginatum]